ncbi:UDP-N-acetylglucosamine 1-carboxyvinyltransferase [Rhizomicrobium electricum]|uniref:UDP-N-acetylglucosamine 1-carboxyvinyltransferase n=1 Tax=Rhizomicrobium electricum TaxID=480070 RepID=A0ABN1E964_9PROT|nr:UDP-N-acetylglucosamine 1-carboxyvinyltransferase [Rhizomicrobium electricum]NIJ47979.1 UDP-N-acetylglucosamine 1-carboxyvinyltransferase [Rhizomicrobium electricum]
MDKISIKGGLRLNGRIPISGAKNAALPLMVASLLTDEPLILTNVPQLADIVFMADLLRSFGVSVDWKPGTKLGEGGTYRLQADRVRGSTAEYDTVRKMRASFFVLGPLVTRLGLAKVSLPGGCAIGARPVDLHLRGLQAMGATIDLAQGYVIADAPAGLTGGEVVFPTVTVGATENVLMAACLAKGTTVIVNAAREPEIVDLGNCLTAMGAKITGLGTSRIVVDGVDRLHGATHSVLPDRIETGTYAIATAIAGGEVELTNTSPDLVASLLDVLVLVGAEVSSTGTGFKVARDGFHPRSVSVNTAPFPGFPTDLQAQFMALMTIAEGSSRIRETIFENRFMHVPELIRMGADIKVEGDSAIVTGVPKLMGAPVMATDLRASSSLVLAGLAAEGETIVNRVYHLDRGFERLEEKLRGVGANIERLSA